MNTKMNYHTHTCYCDGRNTPEAIVKEAVVKGFAAVGFSGHAHTPFDESYAMSHETAMKYKREIDALRIKYADKIDVFCGIEQDFYSDEDTSQWDYVIGSVHYILKDGEYISDDDSADVLRDAVDRLYGGDAYSMAEDFFATEAEVVAKTNCDIIGHFDIITKFNEIDPMFDEKDPRYIAAYTAAIDALIPYGKPFEINTGAISRGYRTTPYPSSDILRAIYDRGGKIAISSDSHVKETLDFGFDDAEALAKKIGFVKKTVITKRGPAEVDL